MDAADAAATWFYQHCVRQYSDIPAIAPAYPGPDSAGPTHPAGGSRRDLEKVQGKTRQSPVLTRPRYKRSTVGSPANSVQLWGLQEAGPVSGKDADREVF